MLGLGRCFSNYSIDAASRAVALLFVFTNTLALPSHSWLLAALIAVNVSTRMPNLIRILRKDSAIYLDFARHTVGSVRTRSGTRQVCPLSGTIFALALDPFICWYLSRLVFARTHTHIYYCADASHSIPLCRKLQRGTWPCHPCCYKACVRQVSRATWRPSGTAATARPRTILSSPTPHTVWHEDDRMATSDDATLGAMGQHCWHRAGHEHNSVTCGLRRDTPVKATTRPTGQRSPPTSCGAELRRMIRTRHLCAAPTRRHMGCSRP